MLGLNTKLCITSELQHFFKTYSPFPALCVSSGNTRGCLSVCLHFLLFLRFYLFIFRERGKEGEREGKKHQCVVASCTSPTGILVCSTGMCHVWESNQQPFGSQAGTQSTEPHQPGLHFFLKILFLWP